MVGADAEDIPSVLHASLANDRGIEEVRFWMSQRTFWGLSWYGGSRAHGTTYIFWRLEEAADNWQFLRLPT